MGPIDNKSGRCDLPSFPQISERPVAQSVCSRVGVTGSLLKIAVLQVKFHMSLRPSIPIENNSTQRFPTRPTCLSPAHCHLHSATYRPCCRSFLEIEVVVMSVDAQGPPNDRDGCAPPDDKSAEHEAAEHGEAQHDATTTENEEVPPPKPQPKLCGICEKQEGKYKCPRCSIP